MKVQQRRWRDDRWERDGGDPITDADLVLLFGSRDLLLDRKVMGEVRRAHPDAQLVGCSTAGEIFDTQVTDDTLVATAIRFDHATVHGATTRIRDAADSFDAGLRLGAGLPHDGLVHVFVLSDGLHVNGSALAAGLTQALPDGVTITGGLSGDGDRFGETAVLWNDDVLTQGIAVVGIYGRIRTGHGSMGGWDPFGPERLVTRARGNILYELDGQRALDLYVRYLGEHATGLPATGLLFPLALRSHEGADPVVRTILSVDEMAGSLTFAGDIPEGMRARLMKANFDRLIDGATGAARGSIGRDATRPELALLISCVGRKLVLKQRIEEEVEAVREIVGPEATLAGFYSYGEISPAASGAPCALHNQTMTITILSEETE